MLDSLALTLALLSAPVARPNLERESVVYAPAQVAPIVLQVASVKPTESLTTCYVNADNTCWGRN